MSFTLANQPVDPSSVSGPTPSLFGAASADLSTQPTLDLTPVYPLSSLWGKEEFADCIVKCKGREWKCHKFILCLRSEWFNTALTGTFEEAKTGIIEMSATDPAVTEQVLRFLYEGCKLSIQDYELTR